MWLPKLASEASLAPMLSTSRHFLPALHWAFLGFCKWNTISDLQNTANTGRNVERVHQRTIARTNIWRVCHILCFIPRWKNCPYLGIGTNFMANPLDILPGIRSLTHLNKPPGKPIFWALFLGAFGNPLNSKWSWRLEVSDEWAQPLVLVFGKEAVSTSITGTKWIGS